MVLSLLTWYLQCVQVAALTSMTAAVYMRVFLEESLPDEGGLRQPILKSGQDVEKSGEAPKRTQVSKKFPTLKDIFCLLKSRSYFYFRV